MLPPPNKTITVSLGVWYNAETGSIHLAPHDRGGPITTDNDNPISKPGHPNLSMKLSRCRRDAGAPHPARTHDGHPDN